MHEKRKKEGEDKLKKGKKKDNNKDNNINKNKK